MKGVLVILFKSNKGMLLSVCTLFLVTGLLVASPTLAFFTSQDEVTNRVMAYSPEIELVELNWVREGLADAGVAEPGDVIAKDPAVYNTSDAAVYVRMKIQVVNESGADITTTDRGKAILSALYVSYTDLSTNTALFYTADYAAAPATLASNNQYFYYYDEDTSTSTYDGWFYYVTEADTYTAPTTYTTLASLEPGETTPTLFETVTIPVRKTEYEGIFDEYYDIVITAQAITVDETLDVTDFSAVVAAFASAYAVGS